MFIVFFFSSRRRHTRWPRDWSSDVCSSDLGFTHFKRFFSSYYFWRLIKNTLLLSLYQLLLFPLPIILALSLNELRNGPFKKWSQTLTYAPHFISVVVVVGMIIIFLRSEERRVGKACGAGV